VVCVPGNAELDLKGIRFLFADGDDKVGHTVTTSGDEQLVERSPGLFKLRRIHATGDDTAYWWVTFDEPVLIRRLLIFNSAGWLNHAMTVTGTREDGTVLTLRDGRGPRSQAMAVAALAKYVREDAVFDSPNQVEDAEQWRRDRVAEVNVSLRSGAPRPTMDDALWLASLIPFEGSPDLGDGDAFLMAYLLMAQTARNESTRSGWAAYRKLLPSRSRLRKLESYFAEAAALLDVPARSLTRHGLVQSSKLSDETAGIGELALQLRRDLAAWGLTPLIAYGSLLGQVREGHLLAHDDDFDSMVCVEASSREAFDTQRGVIVEKLRDAGWEVKLNGKYWNVHVSRPGDPAHIDMFFVHVHDDRAYTHMERMKVRDVPAAWLQPGDVVTVDGIQMAIPREPAKFLEDRYGTGWTVADPYADWAWPLDD
jgi:hypothetical protein